MYRWHGSNESFEILQVIKTKWFAPKFRFSIFREWHFPLKMCWNWQFFELLNDVLFLNSIFERRKLIRNGTNWSIIFCQKYNFGKLPDHTIRNAFNLLSLQTCSTKPKKCSDLVQISLNNYMLQHLLNLLKMIIFDL